MSPEKERATKPQPSSMARAQRSIGTRSLAPPPFSVRADVGRGRELPLRQAVDAVVLDDVDERHVPPHEVDELADADRGGVAVAGDADADQLGVREERARRDGRHPAVDGVEAPGAVQEVGGRLGGAADARELRDAVRLDAHLAEGGDDLLRDDVVAAAEAEGRLRPLVVGLREAEPVRLRGGGEAWRSSGTSGVRPRWERTPSTTVVRVEREAVVLEDGDEAGGVARASRRAGASASWASRFCSTT